MSSRKIHQLLGLILLLPFMGWIATGVVFLIKPGYADAYEKIEVRTYPLNLTAAIPQERLLHQTPQETDQWHEVRLLKTVLGEHLLVRDDNGWRHLSANNLQPLPRPDNTRLQPLISEAIAVRPERYGEIVSSDEEHFYTSTDVVLTLDWDTLSLRQVGADTRLIKTLYRIHYLEWFANPTANLMLGIGGLLALLVLVIYGMALYLKGRSYESR